VFRDGAEVDQHTNNAGYKLVSVRNDRGRIKRQLVHRLLAKAFLGLVDSTCVKRGVVDHINELKDDNRIENLEVVTIKENTIRYHKLKKLKNNQAFVNFIHKFVSFK
jgi:hypothetical protein